MAYHRQQGVDTAIVRIFNTYGPRMRPHDGRAIPTFLRQALAGPADHGLRRRRPDALVLLRRRPDPRHHRASPSPASTSPVNIGNPDEFTLLELAQTVDRGHGLAQRDRLRGAADRRSQAAPPGHHAGARAARLGARRSRCARGCSARSRHPARRRCSASRAEPHLSTGGQRSNTRGDGDHTRDGRASRAAALAETDARADADDHARRSASSGRDRGAAGARDARARPAPPAPAGALVPAPLRHAARACLRDRHADRARRARRLRGAAARAGREGRGQGRLEPRRLGRPGLRLLDVRVPDHGAAVRALGPLRQPRLAARPARHRLLAVLGDGRDARLRRGGRPGVLELLHLLGHAAVRDRDRQRAALGLRRCSAA